MSVLLYLNAGIIGAYTKLKDLPISLQQGDNDAGSLLQALVVYLKLAWRLAQF
jgi:hypothetical protein